MNSKSKNSAIVIFGKEARDVNLSTYDVILRGEELAKLIDQGSMYEAASLLEELPTLTFADGTKISKLFIFKGFDLWWIHYNNLFYQFCIPYTQYKKLLEYLRDFKNVTFYDAPYKSLFTHYLGAYGTQVNLLGRIGTKSKAISIPFGIVVQTMLTIISLPILMFRQDRVMLYTGDKIEKEKDYDARMKFVYEELRKRGIAFVEFIRSLESWRVLLDHAYIRSRPVIYPEAVAAFARFISVLSKGRRRAKRELKSYTFDSFNNPEAQFKFLIATHYLPGIYDEVWGIKIMQRILSVIGVKVTMITAATDRSYQTILACKLINIPTVGILHGLAARFSTPYDYMNGFDGERMFSTDIYGVWSEWWREHYIKESDAYKPEQLVVAGPMRPFDGKISNDKFQMTNVAEKFRVLLVAEQAAAPLEVISYIERLLKEEDIQLTIKFRPARDGFENWLIENRQDVLNNEKIKITKGNMQEAISHSDVVIGCHSTGVLEALLQLKIPIFLNTHKWGDYFGMAETPERAQFFAESPNELIEKIKNARHISLELVNKLARQYFGDPHQNGSSWLVDKALQFIHNKK